MRKLSFSLAVTLILSIFTVAPASAFEGGFVDGEVRLTKALSPYNLTSTIQVPDGSRLVVEAGVELRVTHSEVVFKSAGTVELLGTASEKVKITGASVLWENAGNWSESNSKLVMTHVDALGISSIFSGLDQHQIVNISDSTFIGGRKTKVPLYNFLVCDDCRFERNYFKSLPGFRFSLFVDDVPKVRMANNYFAGNSVSNSSFGSPTNGGWIATDGRLDLIGNSFIGFSKPIFQMNGAQSDFNLDGNYFDGKGSGELAQIAVRDLSQFTVRLSSPLTAPSPQTPIERNVSLASSDFRWKFFGQNLELTTDIVAATNDLVIMSLGNDDRRVYADFSSIKGKTVKLNYQNFSSQIGQAREITITSNLGFGVYPLNAKYSNCKALWQNFDGGVARNGKAKNKGPRAKKRATVLAFAYEANRTLDQDKDGIVCER